jgi:hypothetical protein
VSIQVNDPGNNLVHVQLAFSNQSGIYVDLLSLKTNALQGQYTIYATASKSGYGNGQSQAQFTVSPQSSSTSTSRTSSTTSSSTFHTTTTSTSSSTPTTMNPVGQCLIATATYESELAPEVTLLRNFRDFDVLRTSAGENFIRVFNAFYYSFSPGVASFIASHSTIRAGMKIVLYPLIGILYLSSLVFAITSFNAELAVSMAGVLASLGIGAVYLGPMLAIASRFFKSPSSSRYFIAIRLSLIFGISSLLGVLLAELGHFAILMEITTVGLVLSCIALGGLLVAWIILRLRLDRHSRVVYLRQGFQADLV